LHVTVGFISAGKHKSVVFFNGGFYDRELSTLKNSSCTRNVTTDTVRVNSYETLQVKQIMETRGLVIFSIAVLHLLVWFGYLVYKLSAGKERK
jgi:hypothetical protein